MLTGKHSDQYGNRQHLGQGKHAPLILDLGMTLEPNCLENAHMLHMANDQEK